MLEVRNLVFHPLDNGVEKSIIEDISLAVPDGEMLVITGPNGGGKSTMAKLLMGIEKPDGGQIMLVKQFEQLHKEKKETLILISHQERIIRMADRIMVIRDGKVAALGTKEEVYPMLMESNLPTECEKLR